MKGAGRLEFRRLKAPGAAELRALVARIAERVGRALERRGLLLRDAETSYLALEEKDGTALDDVLGHSGGATATLAPAETSRRNFRSDNR